MHRYIFSKSVSGISADPEKQLGAKNSISPKNDLRSFCTNVTIWKAGKPSYAKPGAYRPISRKSYMDKLLEKLICSRLQSHFSSIGLLDEDQEGFTKQRNTICYLNKLDMLIWYGRHNNKTVLGLFLDFEKAFDSVWLK